MNPWIPYQSCLWDSAQSQEHVFPEESPSTGQSHTSWRKNMRKWMTFLNDINMCIYSTVYIMYIWIYTSIYIYIHRMLQKSSKITREISTLMWNECHAFVLFFNSNFAEFEKAQGSISAPFFLALHKRSQVVYPNLFKQLASLCEQICWAGMSQQDLPSGSKWMFWSSCFLINCSPSTHLLRSSFCVPWCWPKIEWKLDSNLSFNKYPTDLLLRMLNVIPSSHPAVSPWKSFMPARTSAGRAKLFCMIKEVSLERDTQMDAIPNKKKHARWLDTAINPHAKVMIDVTTRHTSMSRNWHGASYQFSHCANNC